MFSSAAHNLCFSVKDQVLYPYKSAGRIIILCILNVLVSGEETGTQIILNRINNVINN